LIEKKSNRQDKVLRMIPSENYASSAVMEAAGDAGSASKLAKSII